MVAEKCPYCGAAMRRGIIVGNHYMHWMDGKPAWFQALLQPLIGRTINRWMFPMAYMVGSRCEKCRRIIVEY